MQLSQTERVLKHLERKSITSLEAFDKYGITRLSAVIFNLRDAGYDIGTEMIEVKNRYGDTCRVAEYTLKR